MQSSREQSGLGFRAVKVKPDLTLSSDQQCPVPNCFTQCPVLVVPSAQNAQYVAQKMPSVQSAKCTIAGTLNLNVRMVSKYPRCMWCPCSQVPKLHIVCFNVPTAHCPSFAGCTNMVPKLGGEQKYAPFTAIARAALLLKQSNINPEICLAVFSVFSDWKISKY